MYRKIISLISLSLLCGSAIFAQTNSVDEGLSFVPKKGNFTASLVLGNNNVTAINSNVLPNHSLYYSSRESVVNRLGADDTFSVKEAASITNMAGISLNYFLTDKISLSLFGSYGSRSVAGEDAYSGVKALIDTDGHSISGTEIPAIQGSPETDNYKLYISAGADYHFKFEQDAKALKNVDFYLGVRVNYAYERLEKTQTSWLTSGEEGYLVESGDAGTATAEALGLGGAIVAGVDYYFSNAIYMGLEVNAFNFMYQHTEIVIAPGVQGADQSTTSMNAFSYPKFKIGFKIF
ncbi:BT1926 family outer membrane beta-barrel protein [Marinifilum sp. RC60d5]|uniref:BT1926 family outer membrane beta-barrel protein n=1 Tax=Marinifilum sp. RC60d5 TaxID=3458414 RepID=UPI0040372FCC